MKPRQILVCGICAAILAAALFTACEMPGGKKTETIEKIIGGLERISVATGAVCSVPPGS
jgi:hypothetical protein